LALSVAEQLIGHPETNPFTDETIRHYYSEKGLDGKPKPSWVVDAKEHHVQGIEPFRFRWYKGIA